MTKIIILLFSASLFAACGSTPRNTAPTGTGEKVTGPINIQTSIPYGNGAAADNVKNECTTLGSKLTNFTESFGAANGVTVNKVSKVNGTSKKGNNLVMEMTNVYSGGNAFLGHKKSVTVVASLYKNGTLVDKVTRKRSSGGGFAGAYKGSCSVLGRTVKALGKDVALWLKQYTPASAAQ